MHFEPLQPLNDIKVLTGSFVELTTQPPVLPNDAFVDIELTDQQPIPDLMNGCGNLSTPTTGGGPPPTWFTKAATT